MLRKRASLYGLASRWLGLLQPKPEDSWLEYISEAMKAEAYVLAVAETYCERLVERRRKQLYAAMAL